MRFVYPETRSVSISGEGGAASMHFLLAEGGCGACGGRFRGAVILPDYCGYGRAYRPGQPQIVATATHMSGGERVAELLWEPVRD